MSLVTKRAMSTKKNGITTTENTRKTNSQPNTQQNINYHTTPHIGMYIQKPPYGSSINKVFSDVNCELNSNQKICGHVQLFKTVYSMCSTQHI